MTKLSDVELMDEDITAGGPLKGGQAALVFACVVILLASALSVYQQRPPAGVSTDAPETEFSSGRARRHLLSIAQTPHPIGSSEQSAVRDYISEQLRAQGVETEVQRATVVNPAQSSPFRAATVNNVVGKLKGTGGEGSVMLAAHYDTVPSSPGAGDDGAGVAALLETLRALKAGPPLANDVIFLFTDGEELGLMGARAFTAEHRWAREVKVVLNFEGRGSGGPSVMFETSDGNGWLVEEFGKAAPAPVANSLSYEIYRLLPNDTDMTVFRKAGFAGLNFAFIEEINRYHSASDSVENLSESSLQHHGSYALSLARRFGNANLTNTRRENDVYFNVPGASLIRYSVSYVIPLAVVLLVCFLFVLRLGFGRGLLSGRGLLIGFVTLLAAGVCTYVCATALWWVIRAAHRGLNFIPWQEPYDSGLYVMSFVLLAVGVTLVVYRWPLKRVGVYDLAVGAALWWLALSAPVALLIPGGSYLFTWPLFSLLVGLAISFSLRRGEAVNRLLVLLPFTLPCVVLLSPLIQQLFAALTLKAAPLVSLGVVLAMGLIVSLFKLAAGRAGAAVMWVALLSSIGLAVAGILGAGFDHRHPATDSLLYALDADKGEAMWASPDGQTDEWTTHFIPAGSTKSALRDIFPLSEQPFLHASAPVLPLPAPQIDLLSDETRAGVRTLRLRISSPRKAPLISIYLDEASQAASAEVNGKKLQLEGGGGGRGGPWGMHYYAAPEEGIELVLSLASPGPVRIRAVDKSYGLPAAQAGALQSRPDAVAPASSVYSEASFVSRTASF
jgi:hypothetical protein